MVLLRCRSLLAGSVALAFSCIPLISQVTTATWSGIATDQSGSVVPGATVSIKNAGTGATMLKTTDDSGEFVFNFIPVGAYSLTISKPGFKTYSVSGIEVQAARNIRQTYTLEVGQTTETVTVTAEVPLVNTAGSEQRESFGHLEITELPLARRNFSNVLSQGSGVISAGNGKFNLNGLGGAGTKITVDGTEASADARSSGTSMFAAFNRIDLLSLEAIQEVQVIKGVVPAEYGQALSGNVNVITRSGTNTLHGTLFYNYQGAGLAARHQFTRSKPNFVWNQFGGSAGGPIVRDRLFVFGAYEGYRESNFQFLTDNVPTELLRQRMLNALRFPETKAFLDQIPLPNQPHSPTASVALWQGPASSKSHDDHYDFKGDYRIGSNGMLSTTYTRGRPGAFIPRVSPINFRTFQGKTDRVTSSFTYGGPAWTSETRFGFNYNITNRLDNAYNAAGVTGTETIEGQRRLPSIRCDACGFTGPAGEIRNEDPKPFYSFEEKFALIRGKHSFKFGGIWSRRGSGRFNVENAIVRYANEADMLANIPNTVQTSFGTPFFIGRDWQLGFFAQDDWRVNRKLVLNLGLRYDFFSKYVAHGEDDTNPFLSAGLFNPDGILSSSFQIGPIRDKENPIDSDKLNLGPRFGFAYNPDGNGRTTIRGGYSAMFMPVPIAHFLLSVGRSPVIPFRTTFSRAEAASLGVRFPIYNEEALGILQRLNQVRIEQIFNPSLESPYAHNFYLGGQHAVSSSLMIESALVSTRGVKFTMEREANLPDRLTGTRPNPNVGGFTYLDNSQQTFHWSWQNSLRKRFSSGLVFNLHYTFGKTLAYSGGDTATDAEGEMTTNTQDFFCIKCERGPATSDIRHYFTGNWVYEVTRFAGSDHFFLKHVLGGWQISGTVVARTGKPFNIGQPNSWPNQRVDITGRPVYHDQCCSFGNLRFLNRDAFALVPVASASGATIRPGNLGNGALRGFGLWNADIGFGKNFRISERARFEARADLLNAFNHTNYTSFQTNINSSAFGVVTNTAGARVIQLNGRLSF